MPEHLIELGLSEELVIFIISMLPVFELRGAIPVGINTFEMPWQSVFILAYLGNLLVAPIILIFLEFGVKILRRVKLFDGWINWLFARTRRKSKIIEKYKRLGLVLFVAVPLPVTGAWTGALAAVLIGMGKLKAFFAISLGIFIAGVIVTTLSLLGWAGALIAFVALAAVTILGYTRGSASS